MGTKASPPQSMRVKELLGLSVMMKGRTDSFTSITRRVDAKTRHMVLMLRSNQTEKTIEQNMVSDRCDQEGSA